MKCFDGEGLSLFNEYTGYSFVHSTPLVKAVNLR